VGFEALLQAANNVFRTVLAAQFAPAEPDREKCALVVAALDAMTARVDDRAQAAAAASGRPNLLWTSNQSTLVASVSEALAGGAVAQASPLGQRVLAAWGRLQATPAFRAMGEDVDVHAEQVLRLAAQRDAARAAAAQAPQCRTCAHAGCGAKEAHPALYKRCSACQAVVYCSKEHQLAAWPDHKKACKAARKAKEELPS